MKKITFKDAIDAAYNLLGICGYDVDEDYFIYLNDEKVTIQHGTHKYSLKLFNDKMFNETEVRYLNPFKESITPSAEIVAFHQMINTHCASYVKFSLLDILGDEEKMKTYKKYLGKIKPKDLEKAVKKISRKSFKMDWFKKQKKLIVRIPLTLKKPDSLTDKEYKVVKTILKDLLGYREYKFEIKPVSKALPRLDCELQALIKLHEELLEAGVEIIKTDVIDRLKEIYSHLDDYAKLTKWIPELKRAEKPQTTNDNDWMSKPKAFDNNKTIVPIVNPEEKIVEVDDTNQSNDDESISNWLSKRSQPSTTQYSIQPNVLTYSQPIVTL